MSRSVLKAPLSRRALLRSGASISIALPFLDAMWPKKAAAAELPKRLFIMVGQNGVVPATFFPTGGDEKNFTLGASLAPLEAHKKNLIILDGIRKMQRGLGDGTAHGRGSAGAITGATCSGKNGIGDGPSIDQPIADKIATGTRFRNMIVGQVNAYAWFTSGPKQKIFGEDSPQKNFDALFSNFTPPTPGGGASGPNPEIMKLVARKKSILDGALEEYKRLAVNVGGSDKARLGAHTEAIRNVEKGIEALGSGTSMASAACVKPATSGESMVYPDKCNANLDLLCLAYACDLTRIGGMQYNTHGQTFSWAGMTGGDHHALAHQQGSAGIDANLTKANAWFASQFGRVIEKLKSYGEGPGTAFDRTLMLWTNELAIGPHKFDRGPFLLASGGMPMEGGKTLQTGRWMKFDNFPHTGVLISMANIFGVPLTQFGFGEWQKGPLPGLI
jgi:hypothetical protein